MKKPLILIICLTFTLILSSVALASTMEIDVSPGVAFDLEHDFVNSNSDYNTAFRIKWGVNDKLCLEYTYTNFDGFAPDRQEVLGLRYEIVNNLAAVADYKTTKILIREIYNGNTSADLTIDSTIEFDLGFRGKLNLSEITDLVGELTWNHNHYNLDREFDGTDLSGLGNSIYSENGWKLYTQVEFKIGKIGVINVGLDSVKTAGNTDTAKFIGAEFYKGKSTIYFDYYFNKVNDCNDLCFGVEFGF